MAGTVHGLCKVIAQLHCQSFMHIAALQELLKWEQHHVLTTSS